MRHLFHVQLTPLLLILICYGLSILSSSTLAASGGGSYRNNITSGRNYYWDTGRNQLDRYKTQKGLWNNQTIGTNGRPTLSTNRIYIVPIYWDGEPTDTNYQKTKIVTIMNQIVQYYKQMSWNKHTITYTIHPQRIVLKGITRSNAIQTNSEQALRKYMNETLKLKEFVDYSSIMLLHNPTNSGILASGGGWGSINGNFLWVTFVAPYSVIRHEIGHNYGHVHHLRNDYNWRLTQGTTEHALDGFDMMSGGNSYNSSDFAAASKWFYNWIPDSSILYMQPEGKTARCMKCVASIQNIVLTSFDTPTIVPTVSTKMGIQIPITSRKSPNGVTTVYSYWLSYRSYGVDQIASKGLSVHLVWYEMGGMFGSRYDSLNYDVFGDTSSTAIDSFIIPQTCYLISPPGKLMNGIDPASVEQIKPIVCVQSKTSTTITIGSITFQQKTNPVLPKPTQRPITCTKQGTKSSLLLDLKNATQSQLLHFTNTGTNGTIQVSVCKTTSASPNVQLYFYDTIPHVLPSSSTPPGYGAYRSLNGTKICSSSTAPSADAITYQTQSGDAYIFIKRTSSSFGSITVQSTCTVQYCLNNQYMSTTTGTCTRCPNGSLSLSGSTSSTQCTTSCSKDGLLLEHPRSPTCSFTDNTDSKLVSARDWRFVTPVSSLVNNFFWFVDHIKFYTTQECVPTSVLNITQRGGTPFDSANLGPGWEPTNAFNTNSLKWGGRPNATTSKGISSSPTQNVVWIGVSFVQLQTIRCIQFAHDTDGEGMTTDVWIQSRTNRTSNYRNVVVKHQLVSGINTIKF